MSILSLKSNNKDFSFIIKKNPSSMLIAKSMKKGTVFGFYKKDNKQVFNIYFKDCSDEISFPSYDGEKFEYLNTTRYNSSSFIVNAINEVLRSAFKSNEYLSMDVYKIDKGGVESEFFINMIYIKNYRYVDAFNEYFKEYNVEAKVICGKNYQITITTKKSIYELLNFVILFGIFQVIVNKEPIFISEDNIKKYVNCMNIIDAPYFIRYLFKIRFIKGMKVFNTFKDELSKNKKNNFKITFGTTWQARQIEIENCLEFKNNILEIGVGEGKYISRFNKYMKNFKYFAIDINKDIIEVAKKRVKNKSLKNVVFFNSTQEFIESNNNEGKIDIILTEVIEHMSISNAKELIELVINKIDFYKFIITTPNSDFNKNYFLNGLRDSDHKFEFSRNEFFNFIEEIANGYEFIKTDFFDIGDIVDEDTPSQGVVLIKK